MTNLLEQAVQGTVRNEEWKYTSVLHLLKNTYSAIPRAEPASVPAAGDTIVVENGVVTRLCDGATVEPTITRHDAVRSTATASPFYTLNASAALYTVQVVIPANTRRTRHVTVKIVSTSANANQFDAVRLRIVTMPGAEAVVHEVHEGGGAAQTLNITVTELVAHAGSMLEYVKKTQLPDNARHIGITLASVKANARVTTHTLCTGGPLVRNDLYVRLEEPGAEAYLNGLSVIGGHDHADNHTAVDHLAPHCHSDQLYKGIYHDASVGVFSGRIFVRPDAQKTTAYQSNRSLLIGDRARVNSKPQLEIWADDVKCSHGATTGQLDAEALFYLRSRRLSLRQATELLLDAFAAEMYNRLPSEQ